MNELAAFGKESVHINLLLKTYPIVIKIATDLKITQHDQGHLISNDNFVCRDIKYNHKVGSACTFCA